MAKKHGISRSQTPIWEPEGPGNGVWEPEGWLWSTKNILSQTNPFLIAFATASDLECTCSFL